MDAEVSQEQKCHQTTIWLFAISIKKLSGQRSKLRKFDLKKLKSNATAYEMMIGKALTNLDLNSDVDKALFQINAVIMKAATKKVGFAKTRNKPWITDGTLDLADEKRKEKINRHGSNLDRSACNELLRRT